MSIKIFVASLPWSTTDQDLKVLFEKYGSVNEAKVALKPSGKSKGFGFVYMGDEAAANRAIDELNGIELNGRKIVVQKAKNLLE